MLDASRGHRVAYPLFFVRRRRLVVPHSKHGFEGTPLSFFCAEWSGLGKNWRGRERRTISDVDRQSDVGVHRFNCDCLVNPSVGLFEDAQWKKELVSCHW